MDFLSKSPGQTKKLGSILAKEILGNISVENCRVISYGKVPWDNKKKYVVEILQVKIDNNQALKVFKICEACFPLRIATLKSGEKFFNAYKYKTC